MLERCIARADTSRILSELNEIDAVKDMDKQRRMKENVLVEVLHRPSLFRFASTNELLSRVLLHSRDFLTDDILQQQYSQEEQSTERKGWILS